MSFKSAAFFLIRVVNSLKPELHTTKKYDTDTRCSWAPTTNNTCLPPELPGPKHDQRYHPPEDLMSFLKPSWPLIVLRQWPRFQTTSGQHFESFLQHYCSFRQHLCPTVYLYRVLRTTWVFSHGRCLFIHLICTSSLILRQFTELENGKKNTTKIVIKSAETSIHGGRSHQLNIEKSQGLKAVSAMQTNILRKSGGPIRDRIRW